MKRGVDRGVIDVVAMPAGTHGAIGFGNPPAFGEFTLDFDPRLETIEIRSGGQVIFEGEFPN